MSPQALIAIGGLLLGVVFVMLILNGLLMNVGYWRKNVREKYHRRYNKVLTAGVVLMVVATTMMVFGKYLRDGHLTSPTVEAPKIERTQ